MCLVGAAFRVSTILWGLLAQFWAICSTPPGHPDTLEQGLVQAYQNNPQLNSQRAVVRETDETVPQALSGYRPTVRITGTGAESYYSTVTKGILLNGAANYPRSSS